MNYLQAVCPFWRDLVGWFGIEIEIAVQEKAWRCMKPEEKAKY